MCGFFVGVISAQKILRTAIERSLACVKTSFNIHSLQQLDWRNNCNSGKQCKISQTHIFPKNKIYKNEKNIKDYDSFGLLTDDQAEVFTLSSILIHDGCSTK